MNLLQHMV